METSFQNQPRISVLLPVYNGGEYLKLSFRSVINQGLSDFEFLILDDGSNDGSFEWLSTQEDKRITLFKNDTNRGLFYNINFLIKKSKGLLLKLWAQDDIMYPHCLQSFVEIHDKYPHIGFSYSGRDMIDEKGNTKQPAKTDHTPEIISTSLHARIAYYTGSIAGNIANVCINKKAIDKVGLFKEHMKISGDFDMWVRLAEQFETGFIRNSLIQLRDHSGQLSRNEKYYLQHVKEDLVVYRYLDNYVSAATRIEGRKIFRHYKGVYYTTLMAKAFLKGQLSIARQYARELIAYDNIFILSWLFLKSKLGIKTPVNIIADKQFVE